MLLCLSIFVCSRVFGFFLRGFRRIWLHFWRRDRCCAIGSFFRLFTRVSRIGLEMRLRMNLVLTTIFCYCPMNLNPTRLFSGFLLGRNLSLMLSSLSILVIQRLRQGILLSFCRYLVLCNLWRVRSRLFTVCHRWWVYGFLSKFLDDYSLWEIVFAEVFHESIELLEQIAVNKIRSFVFGILIE